MARKTASRQRAGNDGTSLPADPTRWSESSKRSYGGIYIHSYSDIEYTCRGCGQRAVFTAAAQKQAYEEQGAYIYQRRVLCGDCYQKKCEVLVMLRQCEERWKRDKETLQGDMTFLQHWHELISAYARLCGRSEPSSFIAFKNRLLKAKQKQG